VSVGGMIVPLLYIVGWVSAVVSAEFSLPINLTSLLPDGVGASVFVP